MDAQAAPIRKRSSRALDEEVKKHLPRNSVYNYTDVVHSDLDTTGRVEVEVDGKHVVSYCLTTAPGDSGYEFLQAVSTSTAALHRVVPTHSPEVIATGTFASDGDTHFTLQSLILTGLRKPGCSPAQLGNTLATLHLESLSSPDHPDRSNCLRGKRFGYPTQKTHSNFPEYRKGRSSWAKFFARHMWKMLQFELDAWTMSNRDYDLEGIIDDLIDIVIPKLLDPLEDVNDGPGRTVDPMLLHGALCVDNVANQIGGENDRQVVFLNGAVFWGHNEYDLGTLYTDLEEQGKKDYADKVMEAYYQVMEKAEPQDQWRDRLRLYGLRTLIYKSAIDPGNKHRRDLLFEEINRLIEKYVIADEDVYENPVDSGNSSSDDDGN